MSIERADEATTWAGRLEAAIKDAPIRWIDRVAVLAQTDSTQDAAVRLAAGRPGLLVLAVRQTSGRGRLGRTWTDSEGLGVAATFALDGSKLDDASLSLAMGLASCRAVEKVLAQSRANGLYGDLQVGLRWPNDVMVAARPMAPRKVSGVLIERSGPLVYAGVGVNVLQNAQDWPDYLASKAVALREYAPSLSRLDVTELLLREVDAALEESRGSLAEAWTARDMLVGTRATFEYDGRRYAGVVKRIDPRSAIRLKLDDGGVLELPALTTSLVKD